MKGESSWVARVRAEEGPDAAMVIAADRCEFRLTYARTEPREIMGNTLDGPAIPDAYGTGQPGDDISSEWYDGDDPAKFGRDTEAAWVDFYAGMGVKEAVHEALEYFRVDGELWLDPHGEHEREIHRLSAEFAAKLARLRVPSRDGGDDNGATT